MRCPAPPIVRRRRGRAAAGGGGKGALLRGAWRGGVLPAVLSKVVVVCGEPRSGQRGQRLDSGLDAALLPLGVAARDV
jgi:hypothetical protein